LQVGRYIPPVREGNRRLLQQARGTIVACLNGCGGSIDIGYDISSEVAHRAMDSYLPPKAAAPEPGFVNEAKFGRVIYGQDGPPSQRRARLGCRRRHDHPLP
jgi:hypothetical protein